MVGLRLQQTDFGLRQVILKIYAHARLSDFKMLVINRKTHLYPIEYIQNLIVETATLNLLVNRPSVFSATLSTHFKDYEFKC